MPLENPLAFLRALQQGRAAPAVTVIFGPQAFLREYVLEALRRRLAGEGFKYRSFQIGLSDTYRTITGELSGADLFAPKRLIVARVLRSYRDRGGEDDGESESAAPDSGGEGALLAALERLDPNVRLALVHERDKLGVRMRRATEQAGALINCLRPFDNQLPQYTELFARTLNLRLKAKEADSMVMRHGGDLAAIANALGTASINAGEDGRIELEPSRQGAVRIPELFEIAETMTRGNSGETLALFDRAIECGRDPIEILALEVIPQVRRMLTAASLMARRKNTAQIAAAVGGSPTSLTVTRAVEGARRFGLARLGRAHHRACELDASFKMGLTRERQQAVAALILELMAG